MSRQLQLPAGAPLSDRLFAAGVEFPCGGEGICNGCRIRVKGGDWQLGCQAVTTAEVAVEVEQWTAPPTILTDDTRIESIEPRDGIGYAIDLGSTTLVAQRVDLTTGEIVKLRTAHNIQARRGADIMSRIGYHAGHDGELTRAIREQLGGLIGKEAREAVVVGNTAMHHIFCGLDVSPLAAVPFRSPTLGAVTFSGNDLGWGVERVTFLPCIGGFVGSDTLAGLAAIAPGDGEALVDLGTNSEVCIRRGEELLCASTAAGPAFESSRFRRGSHLVETVAEALDDGWIEASGRMRQNAPETLTQAHVRQLQLAKAAVAAGLRLLGGAKVVHLAGAFGNSVRESSVKRIGLLPADTVVKPAGNTALRGARALLLNPSRREHIIEDLLQRTHHIELASLPEFQDTYVGEMLFP